MLSSEVKQGFDVSAAAAVTALPLPDMVRLFPGDTIGPSLTKKMRGIVPTAGLSWDVALREPVTDVHTVICTEPLITGAFTSNFDEQLCPSGKQLSTWCLPLPLSMFETRGSLKREEEVLRSAVFDMFGYLEENIQWERGTKDAGFKPV